MPGSSPTSARRCPMIRLNSVDLPTLGRPRIATRGGLAIVQDVCMTLESSMLSFQRKREKAKVRKANQDLYFHFSLIPAFRFLIHFCQPYHMATTIRKSTEKPALEKIFGPRGWLAKNHPNYEFRAAQLEMAEEVESALENRRHLIAEAGTGTGKTLAYLVPVIRSGRRVVISTGTKNLQEQIFFKDLPFLKNLFPELRVTLMKGRQNYLCRQKLYDIEKQPVLSGMDEIELYSELREWEKETETGDRAELENIPDSSQLWPQIDARSETCTGQKCQQFEKCFITLMHQRAA